MLIHVVVDPVEHRRDRRRFARTGNASQQHHALVVFAKLFHDRRKLQLFERRDVPFDSTRDHADFSQLSQQIHTKAPRFAFVVNDLGEVGATFPMEDVDVSLVHLWERQLDHPLFRDGWHFERSQVATDAVNGRATYLQVNVGSLAVDRAPIDFVDLDFFARLKRTRGPLMNSHKVES